MDMTDGERKKCRERILGEILSERDHQDRRWGGARRDARRQPEEWIELIEEYSDKAKMRAAAKDGLEYRRRLIQVAALAAAAVEVLHDQGLWSSGLDPESEHEIAEVEGG